MFVSCSLSGGLLLLNCEEPAHAAPGLTAKVINGEPFYKFRTRHNGNLKLVFCHF
jgi:hypothetical protein